MIKKGRPKITNEEFKNNLEQKYPDILLNLDAILTRPLWRCANVAQTYSLSREYIRQIFNRLYGTPYKAVAAQKRKEVLKGINICNLSFNSELTVFKDRRNSWEMIPLVKAKCEKLGFNCSFKRNTNWYNFKINNYKVIVRTTGKPVYLNERFDQKYYKVVLTKTQNKLLDFLICFVWTKKIFYVLPINKDSNIYKIKENSTDNKDAWYLLRN